MATALLLNGVVTEFNKEIASFPLQRVPSQSLILETLNGFNGTVPNGERWSVVRVDQVHGQQGEFFYEVGAIFNTLRPHITGVQIGQVQINQTGQPDTLILESMNGFSGTVPNGERWSVVRVDTVWGTQGEFFYNPTTVFQNLRPHIGGRQIGQVLVNGVQQNYHYLRKYQSPIFVENFHYLRKYSLRNGECILTVNFVDGTTQQLTYPECPTVEFYEGINCPNACTIADRIIVLY